MVFMDAQIPFEYEAIVASVSGFSTNVFVRFRLAPPFAYYEERPCDVSSRLAKSETMSILMCT